MRISTIEKGVKVSVDFINAPLTVQIKAINKMNKNQLIKLAPSLKDYIDGLSVEGLFNLCVFLRDKSSEYDDVVKYIIKIYKKSSTMLGKGLIYAELNEIVLREILIELVKLIDEFKLEERMLK